MAEEKTMRLSLVAKQINVGTSTILQFLSAKGHKVDNNPNAKLNFEQLTLLAKEYGANHLLEDSEPAKKPIEEPAAPVAAPAPVAVVAPAPEPVVEKIPEPVAVVAPVAEVIAPEPVVEKPVVEAPAALKKRRKSRLD
jgi:translation initiation factor IF-2